MTTILQAADAHKVKILNVFDTKDAAYFARTLTHLSTKYNASVQCSWAVALLNIRDDRLGTTVDLAHEIVMRQLDRCTQFGDRAYPLSEKQISVIADAAAKAIIR